MHTISLTDSTKTDINVINIDKDTLVPEGVVKLTPEILKGRTMYFHTAIAVAIYPDITSPEWIAEPNQTGLRAMRFRAKDFKINNLNNHEKQESVIFIFGTDPEKLPDRCKKLIEDGKAEITEKRFDGLVNLRIKPGSLVGKVLIDIDRWVTIDETDKPFIDSKIIS